MYYIADEVVRLTPERNLAVHGRGQVNPDEKIFVTVARGPYARAPQPMSPERLATLNSEMARVVDILEVLLFQHGVITTQGKPTNLPRN